MAAEHGGVRAGAAVDHEGAPASSQQQQQQQQQQSQQQQRAKSPLGAALSLFATAMASPSSSPRGAGATPPPAAACVLRPAASLRQRMHADNNGPVPAAWLQPPAAQWPTGHQSAAFEAVAWKKSLILSPAEIYAEMAHHGEEKARFHWTKVALLAIVAGMYVGFGFTLCLLVGGNAPRAWLEDSPGLFSLLFGAVGFPFSFTMILVCGAELYTSLCAYMTCAYWEGKVRKRDCVRMWVTSWCWNFVGCAIFVGLMYAAGVYKHKDWYTHVLAQAKVSHGWGETLVRGIFANYLVNVATWQANAAQDMTGKAVAVWLPISAFAMMGFEHCIANQFLIPMAIALGAPVSARQFVVHNLIPATIGNFIGGAVCMATVYAFIYGRPGKLLSAWCEGRGSGGNCQPQQAPGGAGCGCCWRRGAGGGKQLQGSECGDEAAAAADALVAGPRKPDVQAAAQAQQQRGSGALSVDGLVTVDVAGGGAAA